MWEKIKKEFEDYPARKKIAQKMIELGLRVDENGQIFCGDLEITDIALSRAAGVDRRSVRITTKSILNNEDLYAVFKNILPAGPLLKNLVSPLGLGAIEIEALAENSGILYKVSEIIADKGISIRQVHARDPELEKNVNLTVITEKPLNGEVINDLSKINEITKISIIN